jgi:hypothetical protein
VTITKRSLKKYSLIPLQTLILRQGLGRARAALTSAGEYPCLILLLCFWCLYLTRALGRRSLLACVLCVSAICCAGRRAEAAAPRRRRAAAAAPRRRPSPPTSRQPSPPLAAAAAPPTHVRWTGRLCPRAAAVALVVAARAKRGERTAPCC